MRNTLAAVCLHLLATSLFAETLVLDESGYLRCYYRFAHDRASPRLAREGLKARTVNSRTLKSLKKQLAKRGLDIKDEDLPDHWIRPRRGLYNWTYALKDNAPPSAEWMQARFDDSHWVRKQRPFATGGTFASHLGSAYYRTWFSVKEPKTTQLKLTLAFYGGARVFLNGKEIARAFLPEGELTPDSAGEPYNQEAYSVTWEETGYSLDPKKKRSDKRYAIGNLPGDYNVGLNNGKKLPKFRKPGEKSVAISRACWERLLKARRRAIGPLELPKELLKKGGNLLAFEIRGAYFHPNAPRDDTFAHCHLANLSLNSSSDGEVSALSRPSGVQVWTEDPHKRIFAREYLEPGAPTGVLSFSGGLNGAYGKQLVIGSDQELKDVSVTAGELKLKDGKESIAASALSVSFMTAQRLEDIGKHMGGARHTAKAKDAVTDALLRYGPRDFRALPKEDQSVYLKSSDCKTFTKSLMYYDQIGSASKATVRADSCRPAWVSLTIPDGTKPGVYLGTVRVNAAGRQPAQVPVRVKVMDWRVPNAKDFSFMAAVDQSPYGVALKYKSELWSEEHIQKIEKSLMHLGRLGSGWLHIPVLTRSEFANMSDSPIRWILKADGSLDFDFSIMDRYLDLAIKHGGKPRVISFNVMHGLTKSAHIMVKNEQSGKVQEVEVGAKADIKARRKYWGAFATALNRHMKLRGLADVMFWGTPWDRITDQDLIPLLAEFIPHVTWARHSHAQGPTGPYKVATSVYNLPYYYSAKKLLSEGFPGKGWKYDFIHLSNSRRGTQVHLCEGYFPPFSYRVLCERAQGRGMTGVGRMGGDYWGSYCKGMGGWGQGAPVGLGVSNLLCPGKDAADSSQRLEVLVESIQEMEARIYLERAVESGLLDTSMIEDIRRCFVRLSGEPNFIPSGHDNAYVNLNRFLLHDLHHGWKVHADDLYELAAKAAAKLGLGLQRKSIAYKVVPGRTNTIELKIQNSSHKPLSWKASVDVPWLKLEQSEGRVLGAQQLTMAVDTSSIKAKQVNKAQLSITNGSSGRKHLVTISVEMPPAYELLLEDRIFDVEPGKSAERGLSVVNHSALPIEWQLKSPVDWVSFKNTTGKLKAFEQQSIAITVRPPDSFNNKQVLLKLIKKGGDVVDTLPIYTYIITPGSKPESCLVGQKTLLSSVHAKQVLDWLPNAMEGFHVNLVPPKFDEKNHRSFLHCGREEIVYRLEDSNFDTFACKLRFHPSLFKAKRKGRTNDRKPPWVSAKIYVDGRLRLDTGPVQVTEEDGRLVAVPHLRGARKMRIVTEGNGRQQVQWLEPAFYTNPKE